ncbi:MAG: DUF1549 domain-containing protein [Verrucomicrobiales bacterium]|nr:DUF1549 domain-containing protein [Verrucomicrobiales bacterium]
MKSTWRYFRLFVAFFSLPLILSEAGGEEIRTWTDSQGRTVEASYEGIVGKQVNLKLGNGNLIPFPIGKLSPADQDWLREKWNSSPVAIASRIDQFVMQGLQSSGRQPNPKTRDSQFVRRAYLDITGAIPTYDQATSFLESTDPDKRRKLIDELLASEEYVSHTFNWYADQLRVISKLRDFAIYENYIAWIKESIAEDLPWDEFIQRLIVAEGTVMDDPAAGWYLRDYGMPLNNFSSMISTFLGTEITCAQCHDHPFEDWTQMDYYQLAAFLGQKRDHYANPEFNKEFTETRDRIEEEIRTLQNESEGFYSNAVRLIMSFNRWKINDDTSRALALPDDYKYEDAEPGEEVSALTIFGEDISPGDAESPRKAFAQWLTSSENPRFSVNIANRVWDWTFGLPLHNPVDNLSNLKKAQNPELLEYLGEALEDLDFSLKELRRAIYYSEAWQREASLEGATESEIGRNEYPFPGPLLRRMTAEQLWDSYMTLLISDPYDIRRDVADDLNDSLTMNLSDLDGKTAWDKMEAASNLIRKTVGGHAPSLDIITDDQKGLGYRENGDLLRSYSTYFVRASEIRQPAGDRHFLRSWGQADREASDNGSTEGSVPQILHMLNGSLTHFLAKEDSMIFKKAGSQRATGDKLDQIYLSILSRPPEGNEKAIC